MKNKFIYFNLISCLLFMTACNDTRIADMENMVWREELFNITATSKELHERVHGGPFDDFSEMYIGDVKYKCTIGLSNSNFYLDLYNDDNSQLVFYGYDNQSFLDGWYDTARKVKDQEYDYYFNVRLINSCQYYEYCIDNNLEFPTSLTFYGYEQK